jgi:hypothetical protein
MLSELQQAIQEQTIVTPQNCGILPNQAHLKTSMLE